LVGGDDRIKQQLMKDDAGILKLVRGLGGCRRACQQERAESMTAIVSNTDSPPFALDLTTDDEECNSLGFSCPRQRPTARKLRAETKPYFLVGSRCCTMYSTWVYQRDGTLPMGSQLPKATSEGQ
jgi:hypothetical protein